MSTSPYYNKIQVDIKVDDLEQQIANVADGTAGKAYPDLLTAMSITPLPEDGIIFTIDESNEAEKGVYRYDSTVTPEGYAFVRPIDAGGVVEEGNTQAVSGGEVYNKLESVVKSQLLIKNEILNGDFSNGLTGFTNFYAASNVTEVGGRMRIEFTSDFYVAATLFRTSHERGVTGDVFYFSAEIESEIAFDFYGIVAPSTSPVMVAKGVSRVSAIDIESTWQTEYQDFRMNRVTEDLTNKTIFIDNIIKINLTKSFGAGNEPTKEEMDTLIELLPTGYFEGNLNGKYLHLWLSNRLKTIEDVDKLRFNNLITNGDFSKGIDTVLPLQPSVSLSLDGDFLKANFSEEINTVTSLLRFTEKEVGVSGALYYFRVEYESNFDASFYGVSGLSTSTFDVYQGGGFFSFVNAGYTYILENRELRLNGGSTIPVGGELKLRNIVKLNLTKIFGAGNEPSAFEMDTFFEMFGIDYFDELTLTDKQTVLWQLNLNRSTEQKTKKITDLFFKHLDLHDILSSELSWLNIENYFEPPVYYQNRYGDFPNPLEFYNGTPVATPTDWTLRKQEIKNKWYSITGAVPAPNTTQEAIVLETIQMDGYTRKKVSYEWVPGKTTVAYILIPDGVTGTRPAVISTFYDAETSVGLPTQWSGIYMDYALQLVKKGYITMSIGAADNHDDFYYPSKQNPTTQPLMIMALAAANAYHVLTKLDNVDATRVGIIGQSYGGKWAMFASCFYDEFSCGVWSDAGVEFAVTNYHTISYLGVSTPTAPNGAYDELVADGHDLTEIHALMAPRPFLVSGGTADTPPRWIGLNNTIAVNTLLGYENRVAMTNRPTHRPTHDSNVQAYAFFEHFLKDKR